MRAFCLAAALAALPGAAFAGDSFIAGAWSHQTTMISADVPGYPEWLIKLKRGHETRESCLIPADVISRPEALLTQDDKAVCKKRRFSMVAGKFVYDTFCTNDLFPDGLLIVSTGTYTAT